MGHLGIIGGSSFADSRLFASFEKFAYGAEQVQISRNSAGTVYFVQRHAADGRDPSGYQQPHLVNKKAIIRALHELVCACCELPSFLPVVLPL